MDKADVTKRCYTQILSSPHSNRSQAFFWCIVSLMFDDDDPMFNRKPSLQGSEGRYRLRQALFLVDGKPLPRVRHFGWWLLHNCVAHPILGVCPVRKTFELHDWTSKKLNHK